MHMENTKKEWGWLTQAFHWGMFFILIGMYTVAYTMQDMAPSADKWWLYGMHKQIGVTMLLLVAIRLWWRVKNDVPVDPPKLPKWQAMAAQANIHILYLLLFLFPLSGLTMSLMGGHAVNYLGLFTIPPLMEGPNVVAKFAHQAHWVISYLLVGFVGLHIAAGLYHHLFLKDDILKRMLPSR